MSRRYWIVAAAALAGASLAGAQTPGSATLVLTYVPGSRLVYSINIHSEITSSGGGMDSAQLDTAAEVEMKILPGPAAGPYQADLRFLKYATTVHATPNLQATMQKLGADTDAAANGMPAARFQLGRTLHLLSRPPEDKYDEPLQVLEQLVYGDTLPGNSVSVGDKWTVVRNEQLPALRYPTPETLDVSVAAVTPATLTLKIHSHGGTDIPLDQMGAQEKEALSQGFVPSGSLSYSGDATSVYSNPNGVLQSADSSSTTVQKETFTGAQATQTLQTTIANTSKVKLESGQ